MRSGILPPSAFPARATVSSQFDPREVHSAMRFRLWLFAAFVLAPALAAAQATPPAALLALSKHDHTLAIVDPATLKVVARIPVGDDPHEVVASADGRTAWVSNYGFGSFHTLTA